MSKHSIRISVVLMVFSTLLLLVLQIWWLRTEYHTNSQNFQRETDLVFKSTIKQISDTVMFRQLQKVFVMPEKNANGNAVTQLRFDSQSGKNPATDIKFESITIDSRIQDSTKQLVVNRRFDIAKNDFDSTFSFKNGPRDFRIAFELGMDSIDSDSLKNLFIIGLTDKHAALKISIREKEAKFPVLHMNSDSLQFTTDFYRLGSDKLYAAEFENGRAFILKSMIPQFSFSIFLSLLVIFSFGMVYRHLKSQQRLLEQKNEFIANVTHELKTPVATVGVALEAIKDFDVLKNPKKAQEYLAMASQELDRLSRMTDRILKTSIFDFKEEIRLHKEPIQLSDCIQDALQSLKVMIEKAELKVSCKLESEGKLMGNREHLTQMVHNVIENAIKYGAEGKKIDIQLTQKDKQLILVISDYGAGIPEEQLKKVFEKFYRVPSGDVHNVKGHGLGLSYVKGVLDCHNGRIKLENKPAGGLRVNINFNF